MARFWHRWFGGGRALEATPAQRRVKNYSADTGYVYHYCFEGFRRTGPGYEYVFSASANRRDWGNVTVVLPSGLLESWEARHARPFTASERFAIAKLALRAAMDEREPASLGEGVQLTEDRLASIVEALEMS